MKPHNPTIHSSFTLNGVSFETPMELLEFASQLKRDGNSHEVSMGKFIYKWLDDDVAIVVKTSGSTGKPKKIPLAKTSMTQSAIATGNYFEAKENTKALLCLHPKFIAGKMMLVRAMVLGWDLHVVAPEKDALTQYDNAYDFAAMVPYQVAYSIKALNKVKKLIIGGGAISYELEKQLQNAKTKCYATYGMTETATHIAIRPVNGESRTKTFTTLSGVTISSDDKDCLKINAPYISKELIDTNDIVEVLSSTKFNWIGRIDNVINSGGIKIHPEHIEKKLAPSISFPFIITSEKDEQLGERLILVLENVKDETVPNFSEALNALPPFEKPKKIYTLSKFPYTDNGKIKRSLVTKVLAKMNK